MLKEEFSNDTTKMLEKRYDIAESLILKFMDDDVLDESCWMYWLGKLSGILDVMRGIGNNSTQIETFKAYEDWYKTYQVRFYGIKKYKEIQYDDYTWLDEWLAGGDTDETL